MGRKGLMYRVGSGPLALDTAVFIYWIEDHPTYAPALEAVFRAADAGLLQLFTSALSLLEVLVIPYRSGNQALAERYDAFLTGSRGLQVVEIDHGQLRAAAKLRAVFPSIRTPDALQIGAALVAGCHAFLTNDRELPRVPGLEILQLRDLL